MTASISRFRAMPGSIQAFFIAIIFIGITLAGLRLILQPTEERLVESVKGSIAARQESKDAARGDVGSTAESTRSVTTSSLGLGDTTKTTTGLDTTFISWTPNKGIGNNMGGGAVLTNRPKNGLFMFATVRINNTTSEKVIITRENVFLETSDGLRIRIDVPGANALTTMPDPTRTARAFFLNEGVAPGYTQELIAVFDISPELKDLTLDFEGARFALADPSDAEAAESVTAGLPQVGDFAYNEAGAVIRLISFTTQQQLDQDLGGESAQAVGAPGWEFIIIRAGVENQTGETMTIEMDKIALVTNDDERILPNPDATAALANSKAEKDFWDGRMGVAGVVLSEPAEILSEDDFKFSVVFVVKPGLEQLRVDVDGVLFAGLTLGLIDSIR